MLSHMPRTVVCKDCEKKLPKASLALRRHTSWMSRSIKLMQGEPAEEQLNEFRQMLVASFRDSQSAWEDYREHLIEHGLLPSRLGVTQETN